MKLKELVEKIKFNPINIGSEVDKELSRPFCCDLLSIAMGKAPENGIWITVMGNINTIAVATLTDVACIILAEGAILDEPALAKAKMQQVTVLSTELPIFEAALAVYKSLNG
jgi:hypothetical protein